VRVSYQVPGRVILIKAALVGLLALVALAAPNRAQTQVGLVVAAAAAIVVARDVVARQRLQADQAGVVVRRGYAGRRHLAWPQVEAVRIDTRTRFGARAELLELDAGEEIYQLSRYELGTDPRHVAAVLESLRGGAPADPG
jgi:Bacterial PH domain